MSPSRRMRNAFCLAPLLALALALALPTAPASAEEILAPRLEGTYPIEGAFPNGNAFTGTLDLKKLKSVTLRQGPGYDLWAMKFHYSTGWEGVGTGIWLDDRFYFVIAHEGKTAMVSIYRPLRLSPELMALHDKYTKAEREAKKGHWVEVKGDPWWSDFWDGDWYGMFVTLGGDWGATEFWPKDVDTEKLGALGPGKWGGHEHFYGDRGKDESVLSTASFWFTCEKLDGDAYRIARQPTDGGRDKKEDPWPGVALMPDAHTLEVVTGGNDSQGVGYFEVAGKALAGHICDQGNTTSYPIRATVPDGIAAANPQLFH